MYLQGDGDNRLGLQRHYQRADGNEDAIHDIRYILTRTHAWALFISRTGTNHLVTITHIHKGKKLTEIMIALVPFIANIAMLPSTIRNRYTTSCDTTSSLSGSILESCVTDPSPASLSSGIAGLV